MCNRSRDRKRDQKQSEALKRRRKAREVSQLADEFAEFVMTQFLSGHQQ